MKKLTKKLTALLLLAAMALSLAACGPQTNTPKNYDGPALVQSLLRQLAFADTLSDVGESAQLYFTDLPEGAQVKLWLGSGYYADEVALLTLAKAEDAASAKSAAEAHISQLRAQFASYIPEEVAKIGKAVIWQGGNYLIICITDDHANAKLILDHADDPKYQIPGGTPGNTTGKPNSDPQGTTAPSTSVPPTTVPPTTGGSLSGVDGNGYPILMSQSGKYENMGNNIIRVDNCGFEPSGYHDGVTASYADLVNKVADSLAGTTKVYSLAIPTAFGITLPNDIQAIYPNYVNQGESIENLISKFSSNVIPVRCYDNLMRHRDEYLYFRTDHHWNGTGAYYAYEAFCETKGITPYTMEQRTALQFTGFLGSLYTNTGENAALLPADTVYAFKPYCNQATMKFYDNKGNEVPWSIISDVTDWKSGAKYSTFAGADNPLAIFTNPQVTDGSVCIVVKESFGNALLPYLVDHYSTVYEIDYRYWKGDLAQYAREVGADDLIFANNIVMISTSLLVGKLANIIK